MDEAQSGNCRAKVERMELFTGKDRRLEQAHSQQTQAASGGKRRGNCRCRIGQQREGGCARDEVHSAAELRSWGQLTCGLEWTGGWRRRRKQKRGKREIDNGLQGLEDS